MTTSPPNHPTDPATSQMRLALTSALLEGDAGGAFHLVRRFMAEGVPFDDILFDLFAPMHADVGSRWQVGDYAIAQEHAASGAVETLLAMLAGSFDMPEEGETIVVACPAGDHHSIPARMVAAYLLYLGRRVVFLGADMPAHDLGAYLAEERPAALVLSTAMVTHLRAARHAIAASHATEVPVLVGGKAYGEGGRWAPPVGADAWGATLQEVDLTLSTWEPDPAAAEAAALPETDELARLIDRRLAVLAEAADGLAATYSGSRSGRLRHEQSLLLDATEASVLVADADVVGEFAAWQDSLLAAHGYEPAVRTAMVEALRAAVAGVSPTAAGHLAGVVT